MSSFRELVGNLKQGDSSAHTSLVGSLVVDAVTQKVYIHDGVTEGGKELGGTTIGGATGDDGASGEDIDIYGGNSLGSSGGGGIVYITGGSVLGNDDFDQGGNIVLLGGGSSFGRGGDITISGGDPSGLILLLSLPTSDPHVANAVWNSSGTLKISSG